MSTFKLLLAEDDPIHRRIIEMALKRSRPEIDLKSVANGRDFLEILETQRFDCILLDFNLPDYRSDELLRLIADKISQCPTIVISSSIDQNVVIHTLRNGGIDFIPKSDALHGDTLWRRIDAALLKKHKVEKERRQMVRRVKRLSQLAETDPLTGLSNRLHLERILSKQQRQVYDRRGPAACVLLDLDHFKDINDTYGHLAGDRVLCCIADILKECIGCQDTVCRWGGEEFLVLLASSTLGQALLWAETVRKIILAKQISYAGHTLQLTASFGVISCPNNTLDMQTLDQADQALYLAKCSGRNRVCTGTMAALELFLKEMLARYDLSPEQRWTEILAQADDLLGPTQREQLTDHCARVGRLATSVGMNLNIDPRGLDRLRQAGLFHDVGKFTVPEDLLAKPAALSTLEREVIARCAGDSVVISRRLGVDSETANYIRYHHIRFEDLQKLQESSETEIPLGANVLAVADAFVAMTSNCPYHPALPLDDAIREVQNNRGTQFDPVVVEALEETVEQGGRAMQLSV